MDWDSIEGNWHHIATRAKDMWGGLTDDDLAATAGKRDRLAEALQERCGYARERAEKELDDFAFTLLRQEVPGIGEFAARGLSLMDGYRAMCAANTGKGKRP